MRGHMTTTKSGKTRGVPISPALQDTLDKILSERSRWDEPGGVFASPCGMRWVEWNFARAFNRLRTKARKAKRVRPLHFHCARHTFASWALEGGRSIEWVQAMLGHASAKRTPRTYSHLMPSADDDLDSLLKSRQGQNKEPGAGMEKP